MVEIDRIEKLAAEKGLSLSFISLKLNHNRGYLKDKKLHNAVLDENTLCQIADILGTTADYLQGKTDKKEKVTPVSEGDLTADELDFILKFRALSPEKQQALLLLADQK